MPEALALPVREGKKNGENVALRRRPKLQTGAAQQRRTYPIVAQTIALCRVREATARPTCLTIGTGTRVDQTRELKMKADGRVLIADDQGDVLEALRLLLKGQGFDIESAHSPAGILMALETQDWRCWFCWT